MEKDHIYTQSAVIPWRKRGDRIEILLITTRKRKRWVIPKGIVEYDMTPAESAAKEALEEAGVEGELDDTLLGVYQYNKWGGTCACEVFSLRVTLMHDTWEENYRLRQWHSPGDAASRIREADLAEIIRRFAGQLEVIS